MLQQRYNKADDMQWPFGWRVDHSINWPVNDASERACRSGPLFGQWRCQILLRNILEPDRRCRIGNGLDLLPHAIGFSERIVRSFRLASAMQKGQAALRGFCDCAHQRYSASVMASPTAIKKASFELVGVEQECSKKRDAIIIGDVAGHQPQAVEGGSLDDFPDVAG